MQDELFQQRTRFFQEFLDEDYGNNEYKIKINKMLKQGQQRLIVNINHLRTYNQEYCKGILEEPADYLPCFDKALKDVVMATNQLDDLPYYIGLEGSFGANELSPRQLSAQHLGKMICLTGIVSKCSLVRPKVQKSVHYCEATGLFSSKEYRDGAVLGNNMPTSSMYLRHDEQGNPLTTEFGYSVYRDHQVISVQEMPERSPAGELPRPVDIILDDDLVDKVKPGDRVMVVGVYRTIGKNSTTTSATFKTLFLCNNIAIIGKEIQAPVITDSDVKDIMKISKRKNLFELVSSSLCPSIYGHDFIKKALLLLMLGGVEKDLENGTHLRGDINILLIGDPSVGKSQMLRFVLKMAPLAIATTGRGSSGVGLTAAVVHDKETGERTLEAGAMVLADRGIVCIDEFDKMSDIDRVAIHEVMEQQTVTIAKAGIHTSLNARCSVLAAANPAFGSYLDEKKPFENITMPDSLLSRFDLVFVVLDKTDDEFNRKIAEHVTRLHRYSPPGIEDGTPILDEMITSINNISLDQEKTSIFQKYNEMLHIGLRTTRSRKEVEILSIDFLKKYIYYAKSKITPVLSQEACDYISQKYGELRSRRDGEEDQFRTMPITPRTLETLIRLSTAHSKLRLSKTVSIEDAQVAFELLCFALFKEFKQKKREKRVKATPEDSESDDETGTMVTEPTIITEAATQATGSGATSGYQRSRIEAMNYLAEQSSQATASAASSSLMQMTAFKKLLHPIRQEIISKSPDNPMILLRELQDMLTDKFTAEQVKQMVIKMSDDNTGLWYQEDLETIVFI